MSWIEGVGDEVTVGFGILLLLAVVVIAWVSTGIRDIPFINVIIVQLTTYRRRQQGQNDSQGQGQGRVQRQTERRHISGRGTVDSPLVVNITVRERDRGQSVPEQGERSEGQSSESSAEVRDQSVSGETVATGITVQREGAEAAHQSIAADSDDLDLGSKPASEISKTAEEDSEVVPSEKELRPDNAVQQELSVECVEAASVPAQGNSQLRDRDCENIEALTETELRRRRVAFYGEPSKECTENPGRNSDGDLYGNVVQCGESSVRVSTDLGVPVSKSLSQETKKDNVQESAISSEASGLSGCSQTSRVSEEADSGSRTLGEDTHETEVLTDGEIRVRLKYLNETQRLVTAQPTETIGAFRRKHFAPELSQSKLVRFIFNGQDLRNDTSTLQACNILDNSVIHCLITQPRQQATPPGSHADDNGLDIGNYMFPLFGLLLGIIWYLRFSYRQFFNVSSTLMLTGITFLFLAASISSFRRVRGHEHLE